jgi:hypothetical protein
MEKLATDFMLFAGCAGVIIGIIRWAINLAKKQLFVPIGQDISRLTKKLSDIEKQFTAQLTAQERSYKERDNEIFKSIEDHEVRLVKLETKDEINESEE